MMDWKEYNISIDSDAEEIVAEVLIELGANGVSIRNQEDLEKLPKNELNMIWELDNKKFPNNGVIVTAYFSLKDIDPQFTQILHKKLQELKNIGLKVKDYKIETRLIKNEDWENNWKEYYHPVAVTRYLTIVPEWEHYQPETEEEKIIRMDPGLSFGTGTHPTTQLSLQALEVVMRAGDVVADVGTGSGILAIASALMGAGKIYAYDLDEMAVDSAQSNIKLNNLPKTIHVQKNNLLEGIYLEANIVLANILTHILIQLVADAFRVLKNGGYFISSGIIIDKKDEMIHVLEKKGFQLLQINQIGDWIAIIAQKPF